MATQNGGDEKAVEEIVYKLKSQGLFDQLRKECLNDVDTKPAYQNLRQRVEGYVSRFLSQQTWSPNLNKNQLRDSLRRQINQSGMLSSGVERIIEQVVNPKIFNIIKPKIDEIVCRHLGLDPEERHRQLEARKQRQQQFQQQQMKQQQQTLPNEPVPLMSLGTSPGHSPGYDGLSLPGNNPYAAYSPSANWHRPYGTMLNPHLNANYQVSPQYPQSFGAYGMTSPLYPYSQQGWGIHTFPGMVPPLFTQPPPPIPPNSVAETPSIPQAPPFTEPPPPLPTEPYTGEQDKEDVPAPPPEPEPPSTGLTPPGISPVTLPPTTPSISPAVPPLTPPTPAPPQPDQTTDKSTDSLKQPEATKSKEKLAKPETKAKAEGKQADGTYNILKDIPLPIPLPGGSEPAFKPESKKKPNGNGSKSREKPQDTTNDRNRDIKEHEDKLDHKAKDQASSSRSSDGSKSSKSELKSQDEKQLSNEEPAVVGLTADDLEQTKQYTFSWSAGALSGPAADDDDGVSSLSVSSVHTSDLSSFEDDVGSGSEIEESTANEDAAAVEKPEETTGESADISGSQSESVDVASPVKQLGPVKPPSPAEQLAVKEPSPVREVEMEVDTVQEVVLEPGPVAAASSDLLEVPVPMSTPAVVSPPKPKKLVSLMYNYSDSDDDETREERKARIAREKEDRYAKRLQRRAELEAKRKEREEERMRMKEEKRVKLSDSDKKTQSEDSETTKTSSGNEQQKSEESEDKAPTTVPGSPKKKTKQELKDQLREQKMEKKLALRRQRTRTRRYTSEEFTSIFTEKQQPFSSQSYAAVEEVVESECVVETTIVEETVETVPLPDVPAPVVIPPDAPAAVVANTPPVSPARSACSPATPTQDEPCVYPDENTSLPTGIPVYEISATPSTALTIGQVVHETRSRTRKLSDERKSNETHSTGRPGSPFSDISETSKPESIGEQQDRRPKRRRLESTSPVGAEPGGGKTRRTSGVSPTDTHKTPVESPEGRGKGQRYSVDDLYKPRTSHRRSFSPPPSPPTKPKPATSGARLRSSPLTDRSNSPPPHSTRRHTSPPPLNAPHSSKRYDADELYKPRQPSSRSSRYLQRQPQEPSPTARDQGSKLSDSKPEDAKRDLPFAAKSLTEEDPTGDRECSPTEAERKRHKQPISLVDFGEAARRIEQRKPQDKFRGRSWGKDHGRYERKPQMIRKYYDGGWSDVEKPGSRSPGSSHSSGSGSHYPASRRDAAWKDTYDSEPSIMHRSGSHSPSKVPRSYDLGEPGPSSIGRNRSPPGLLPYDPAQNVGAMRPPSPSGFESRRPPSPPSPGRRRVPSPYSPGDGRSPSPLSPDHHRPPSPLSPGAGQRRPPSPPSPPSPPRHPPSPPSPDRRRPPSPSTPPSDPGPRTTRRHPAMSPPSRRQTRNSLYRPVMSSPSNWGSRGRSWDSRGADDGRYLRSRSPPRAGRSRDSRGGRGGKGNRGLSPPPAKRPKR